MQQINIRDESAFVRMLDCPSFAQDFADVYCSARGVAVAVLFDRNLADFCQHFTALQPLV